MAFSSSSSSLSALPNITPLIDVLLVLLIIFMVIVPVSPRGLESLVPEKSSARTPPRTPLLLEVLSPLSPAGVARYRLAGHELDLVGLRAALRRAQPNTADRALFVGADPELEYHSVATAISEAKQAGFISIGLLPRKTHAQQP